MYRKLNLVKNILASNRNQRLKKPFKATFIATFRCNLRCTICEIWKKPVHTELSVEEIEKIFSRMDNLSWLDLSGGEISLREDVLDVINVILQEAKKLEIIHISTNGLMAHTLGSIVDLVLDHGLTPVINISIDGPAQLHDRLRGKEGSFRQSLDTFRALRRTKKGECYISTTISNYNINGLEALLSTLRDEIPDFSSDDIHFNIFHTSAHYYTNEQVNGRAGMTFEKVRPFIAPSRTDHVCKRILTRQYAKGLERFFSGNRFPARCQALKNSFFMDPYGTLYPCISFDNPLGSIQDYDYEIQDWWMSPGVQEARHAIACQKCPGCWTPCEAYNALLSNRLCVT